MSRIDEEGSDAKARVADKETVRVLLCEDSATSAEAIVTCLEEYGYVLDFRRVETAKTVREALEEVPWDIVLSDFDMGDFDAFGVLEILRGLGRVIPCIVVSGSIGEELVAKVLRSGADDYVSKSRLVRLAPAVDRELARARERQQRLSQQDALARTEREIALRTRMDKIFLTAPDAEVYPAVLNIFLDVTQSEVGLIGQALPSGGLRVLAEGARRAGDWIPGEGARVLSPRYWEGPLRKTVDEMNTVTANLEHELPLGAGTVRRSLVVPIIHKDKVIGLICVAERARPYDVADELLLELLSEAMAPIMSARLSQEARESELRESMENYHALFETAPDLILIIDSIGRIVDCNGRVDEVLRFDKSLVRGRELVDLVEPSHQKMIKRCLIDPVLGEPLRTSEFQMVRGDGVAIDVNCRTSVLRDANGRWIRTTCIIEDVSEKKRLERQMKHTLELEEALDHAARLFITPKDQDLSEVLSLLGKAIEADRIILFRTQDDGASLVPCADWIASDGICADILEAVRLPWLVTRLETEGEVTIKDLTQVDEEIDTEPFLSVGMHSLLALPVMAPSGEVIGIAAVLAGEAERSWVDEDLRAARMICEMTALGWERVRMEEQLRVSEEQFRQSQKLEAVGRLAGGVAHDFNNILTAVIGYADALARGLEESDPRRRFAVGILRSSERAADLIRRLLAFSRKQVLRLRTICINTVIVNLGKILPRMIGEDVEIVTDTEEDLGWVRADGSQVEQILLNLIVNARDAMPDGGTITITTRNLTFSDDVNDGPADLAPGDYIQLSVADTGCGMTDAIRARIFEPFYTTKEVGKGTGLGLAMVHGCVTQNEGVITVESRLEEGTTFTVYLPRVEPEEAVDLEPYDEEALRGSETVLVVEDEEDLREFLCEILRFEGYRVLEAADGAAALDVAASTEDAIDLLVADVVMPKKSGIEVARVLKAARPEMRVILISGYTDRAFAERSFVEEKALFLPKPFRPAILLAKVREALDTPLGNH